jgi:hypothetical protein
MSDCESDYIVRNSRLQEEIADLRKQLESNVQDNQQWLREHDAKVLENTANHFDNCGLPKTVELLREMASELRRNKGGE